MRSSTRVAELPRGSMRRVPLVAAMLRDRGVRFVDRRLDLGWWAWEKLSVPKPIGFRPLTSDVMRPRLGPLADWFRKPDAAIRTLNVGDRLLRNLLFTVHDYLHVWANGFIAEQAPSQFASRDGPSAESRETAAFVHLATEACATVGLDYWYLSTVELAEVVDSGTAVRVLSTSYHEDNLPEFRRANPTLEIQAPAFFASLANFYCTGGFPGFDARDVAASPLLKNWLEHELSYGRLQRSYIRQYLAYAHGCTPPEKSEQPLACDKPWQRRLLQALASALWAKVKDGDVTPVRPVDEPAWKPVELARFDPRFSNLASLSEEDEARVLKSGVAPAHFRFAAAQYLGSFETSRVDRDKLPLIELAIEAKNSAALYAALKNEPRLTKKREPHFVMFVT